MDVISRRTTTTTSSTLNPNAPMFVPLAYRTVEDFSTEWWALVQSSPWFQDYWLQERFQDPQNDPFFPDINDPALPDDVDALFDDVHYPNNNTQAQHEEEEEEKDFHKELVSMGLLKWRKGRPLAEAPRFIEKAPKIVNVMKVSPRAIQQPSSVPRRSTCKVGLLGKFFRFLLLGHCCKPPTTGGDTESLGYHGISAATLGLWALAYDLFNFEITSQVPEDLSQHVVSSKKAQANW